MQIEEKPNKKSLMEGLRDYKGTIMAAVALTFFICGGVKYLDEKGIIKFGGKEDFNKEDVSKVPVGIGQTERLVIEDDNFDDGDGNIGINPNLFAENENNSPEDNSALQPDKNENNSDDDDKKSGIKTAGNKDDGPTIPKKRATPEKTSAVPQKVADALKELLINGQITSDSDFQNRASALIVENGGDSYSTGNKDVREVLQNILEQNRPAMQEQWVNDNIDLEKSTVDSNGVVEITFKEGYLVNGGVKMKLSPIPYMPGKCAIKTEGGSFVAPLADWVFGGSGNLTGKGMYNLRKFIERKLK